MPGRIAQLGDRARARSAVEVARARAGIDRHRDRPLVDVALTLHERDGAIAGAVISSAIAFRLFLFFVPLPCGGCSCRSRSRSSSAASPART